MSGYLDAAVLQARAEKSGKLLDYWRREAHAANALRKKLHFDRARRWMTTAKVHVLAVLTRRHGQAAVRRHRARIEAILARAERIS